MHHKELSFSKLFILIVFSIILFTVFLGICLFEIFRPIIMEKYCSRKVASSVNPQDHKLIKPKDLGVTHLSTFTFGDNDTIYYSFYRQLKCEQEDKLFYIL